MSGPTPEDWDVLQRELARLEHSHRRLLEQHARLHDRARRSRLTLPAVALAVAGVALGAALGRLATHPGVADPPVPGLELAQAPPERAAVLQPAHPEPHAGAGPAAAPLVHAAPALSAAPPIELESSASSAFQSLQAELDSERAGRRHDQQRILDLTEQLLAREQELLVSRQASPQLPLVPGPESVVENAAENAVRQDGAAPPAEAEPDPWLPVLNGLLDLDGYRHLRFEAGERVPGRPELAHVMVLEWNQDGIVDALIKAERVSFELHRMTQTMVARFHDGHRTSGGLRVPLPRGGARVDFPGINVAAWTAHFPELALTSGEEPTPEARIAAESVRRSLDALLSLRGTQGYYRLSGLGAVESGRLRFVQLNAFDADGGLRKTFEADSLEVLLHANGTVELVLRNGAILEGFLRRPFSSDVFRLYLTQQSLDEWRRSGAPCREAGP